MNPLKLTRRRFLSDIAGAGLAISLGNFTSSLSEQNTMPVPTMDLKSEIEKSRSFMIFSKQLEWITNYNELCELVAEIGFNGIELTVRPGGYVLPERVEEDLPKVAEAAKNADIEITMISTRITDPGDPFAEIILKTASNLGIKLYRMGGLSYTNSKSIEETLEEYKIVFEDLAELNKEYGMHGAYQNHAGSNRVSASIWDLWFLLKDLDSRWIGCQYDTRHAQLEGSSWWPIGLRLLNSHIKTTVVKDFKWNRNGDQQRVQNCPIGEGVVDFPNYFAMVKEYDITGPISMHFPYQLMEGIDELDYGKRIKKTKEVMTQNGVKRLKTMLEQAALN